MSMRTLNLKEAAKILNVPTDIVRRYIKASILPMRKLNGRNSHYKISEEKFNKWYDEVWDTKAFQEFKDANILGK